MNVRLIINERQWEDLKRRCQDILGEDVKHIVEAPEMSLDYFPSKGDWVYFHVLIDGKMAPFPISAQIEDVAHWLNAEAARDEQKGLFLRIGKLAPCKQLNPFEAFKP